MVFGATADRAVDPVPDLSVEERTGVNRLSAIYLKWSNPEEVVLGMAGMSPH